MKILHVVGYLGRGGDTSIILNVLSAIDEKEYQFDFVTHIGADEALIKKLRENNINVYILDGDVRKLGPIKYYFELKKLLSNIEDKYDAIHVHTAMQSGIALMVAKRLNIKIRICHSHVSSIQRPASSFSKIVSVPVLRYLYKKYTTCKVACSKLAGEFLFGKDKCTNIIYNAVDVDKFINVSKQEVDRFRAEIKCNESDILIGQIASFKYMKNQDFVVELAKKTLDRKDIKFVLVGSGEDFSKVESLAEEIKDKVILLGQRKDINIIMKSLDCVILPSRPGEGFPVTIIEAQAAGCSCIISENVTEEVEVGLELVKQVRLSDIEEWCTIIKNLKRNVDLNKRNSYANELKKKGFQIDNVARQWVDLYK